MGTPMDHRIRKAPAPSERAASHNSTGTRRNVLAGDLRDEIEPIGLGVTRTAAFAHYNGKLVRLAGGAAREVGSVPEGDMRLVGVDRYDTPIFKQGSRLVRWSERGGWRVLLRLQTP